MSIDFDHHPSWRIDGIDHRFHDRYPDGTLILLAVGTSRIMPIQEAAFEELYANGRAISLKVSRRPTPPLPISDERLVEARMRLWWAQRHDKDPGSLSRQALRAFIRKHKDAAGAVEHAAITPTMLHRTITKRGTPGSRRLSDMIDGRSIAVHPSPFDEAAEGAIQVGIDVFYERLSATKRDAYVAMREVLREADFKGRIPCRQTLSERIEAAATFANVRRKLGALVAQARFRGVGKGLAADRPLECVVIDATPLDVLIVDSRTGAILGVPIVYKAVDVATRAMLAWHVAFGGEKLASVLRLVMKIITPAVGIRERHGLVHDHDCWGLPSQIILDNPVSQIGRSFLDSMNNIGIDAEFAPIGTPEYKSVVERAHHTIKGKGIHSIGGARPLPRKELDKLGVDPKITAVATLEDAEKLLAAIIVDDYQRSVHSAIGMAPARAWAEGITRHKRRIVEDLQRVSEELGTYGTALLTREGVRFRNHTFHDQGATTGLLHDLVPKRRSGPGRKGTTSSGTARVKFKWDEETASRILVWNPVRSEYVPLPNTRSRWVAGLSFESCDVIRRYTLAQNENFESEEDRLRARSKVIALIEALSPGLAGKRLLAARSVTGISDPLSGHVIDMVASEIDGGAAIPIGLAAPRRVDGALTEPGRRRGGRPATRKAIETRAARRRGETTPDQRMDAVLEPRSTSIEEVEPRPVVMQSIVAWPETKVSAEETTRRGFSEFFED